MVARLIAVAAAFGLGWLVCMIGMVLTVYDGALSLLLQPFLAALVSGVCVAVALLVGLLLRLPLLFAWWTRTSLWAGLLAGTSLLVLAFGYSLGLTEVGTKPETGDAVVVLHPAAALGGYFLLLFAVANWPASMRKRRDDPTPQPAGATAG